jgi:adenylylsulfate reductase, subunit A
VLAELGREFNDNTALEYVGGYTTFYVTSEKLVLRGLELLAMLREDLNHLGAEELHQLQRAWELHHRVLTSESVSRHTLFRKETRWPGYYYCAYHPKLNDQDWHVFTGSSYNAKTGEWRMEKLPVHHIID